MNAGRQQTDWYRQIGPRLRRLMLLKAIGTTIFMYLFFVAYLHLLRNPVFAVTQMPLTVVDDLIGFYPPALALYVSLWVYVSLPPALLLDLRQLITYGWWVAGLCVAGLACFYFWPTAIPAHAADWGRHPGFEVLQGIDAAANACPSLHVATAAFSAVWLDSLLREMGAGRATRHVNWLWFVGIAYSTLAIKQHVALDVFAGLLLGVAVALLSLRHRPAPRFVQSVSALEHG